MITKFVTFTVLLGFGILPAAAEVLWEYPTGTANPQAIVVDADRRDVLYVALKERGLEVLQVGRRAKRVAGIGREQLAGLDAMNLWQRDDLLFVALGSFFNARGSHAGMAIVDVGDPTKPKLLSVWKSEKKMRGSAVVVAGERHAYLGVMDAGVMSFDIADPAAPKVLATFQPDIHFPRKNPGRIQHPNARGMELRGDRLFVCYDAGGLRVLDVRDPAAPKEVGRYSNATMARKQSAYNNILLDGDRAYLAVDYAGLEVIDIGDPRAMKPLGWWNPWNADTNANLWINSPGHTNQIAFDKRRGQVSLSAGDSELVVVDVSDPRAPKRLPGHGAAKNGLGVWGLARDGDRAYLAYIKTILPFKGTWAGIKAVRVGR